MGKLEGKVALITGAGRGMGRSHGLLMAKEGAEIIVQDIDSALAEESVAMIRDGGGRARAVVCDVADVAACTAEVAAVEAKLGHIDILVNNAGIDTAEGRHGLRQEGGATSADGTVRGRRRDVLHGAVPLQPGVGLHHRSGHQPQRRRGHRRNLRRADGASGARKSRRDQGADGEGSPLRNAATALPAAQVISRYSLRMVMKR